MWKWIDQTMNSLLRVAANRNSRREYFATFAMVLLIFTPLISRAADPITFGIDWRAEAEYGGYYQAVATGIYARHGLSVTIQEGGPQVNHMQLLLAGRLDFNLGGGRAIDSCRIICPSSRSRRFSKKIQPY